MKLRVDRARHQVERGRLRSCPACGHPVPEHAIEDGHRVCRWGDGVRTSCRACAESWARDPVTMAFAQLGRILSTPPSARRPAAPIVLS